MSTMCIAMCVFPLANGEPRGAGYAIELVGRVTNTQGAAPHTMLHGPPATGTVAMRAFRAVLITETLFPSKLALHTRLPSAFTARAHGPAPTATVVTREFVAVSMTATLDSPLRVTYARLPVGPTTTAHGPLPTWALFTLAIPGAAVSMIDRLPPFAFATYTLPPAGWTARPRGSSPTCHVRRGGASVLFESNSATRSSLEFAT